MRGYRPSNTYGFTKMHADLGLDPLNNITHTFCVFPKYGYFNFNYFDYYYVLYYVITITSYLIMVLWLLCLTM